MARTSDPEVRAIIESKAPDQIQGDIATEPFITAATNLVDWLLANCPLFVTNSVVQMRDIETWLAAHFYSRRDHQYTSKSTGGASGSYQNQAAMFLAGSIWGQTAINLDASGCLANLNLLATTGKQRVQMAWLGRRKSEQTPYSGRN